MKTNLVAYDCGIDLWALTGNDPNASFGYAQADAPMLWFVPEGDAQWINYLQTNFGLGDIVSVNAPFYFKFDLQGTDKYSANTITDLSILNQNSYELYSQLVPIRPRTFSQIVHFIRVTTFSVSSIAVDAVTKNATYQIGFFWLA